MSGDLHEMMEFGLLKAVTPEDVQRVRVLAVQQVPRPELLEVLNMIGIGNPVKVRVAA